MELDTSRLHGRTSEEPPPALAATPAVELPTPLTSAQIEELRQAIVAQLQKCYDPEIPVNIYELGLIYDIEIEPSGAVHVRMTLTSPACPVAGSLPGDVKAKLCTVPNATEVKVDVVWDPPWDKDRMSEAAKLQLGLED